MTGLLDIAPARETVTVAGIALEVRGISMRVLAQLIGRFPELRAMLAERQVDSEVLLAMAPDALGAIIAAGLGKAGDPATEAFAADELSIEAAGDIIAAILRLTVPGGVAGFFGRMGGVIQAGAAAGASGRGPATITPPPSNG